MKKSKEPPATGPEAAKRFESFARRIMRAPKTEIDKRDDQERRKKRQEYP